MAGASAGTSAHQGHGGQMSQQMEQCIRTCEECHRVCLAMVAHCLQMGGPHAEANHIRRLLDCAQICAASADFMIRGSDLHGRVCGVCAEICQRCAEDCERFSNDSVLQQCAEVCRRCAESCRQMAAAVA
jgi:hypothetical protein